MSSTTPSPPPTDWPTPETWPALSATAVHVWRVELGRAPSDTSVLSGDEQARAERFRRDEDRSRFVAAHTAAREILARYLDTAPGALRLVLGEHDKPALAPPCDWLRFNLAHSGAVALVAVSGDRSVGVDVEVVAPRPHLLAIARRALDARAVATIEAAAPAEQVDVFFGAWVQHEAKVKCVGTGLLDDQTPAVGLTVVDLDVAPGYRAAVAAPGPSLAVARFAWA